MSYTFNFKSIHNSIIELNAIVLDFEMMHIYALTKCYQAWNRARLFFPARLFDTYE